jgi:hypothetical protein
MDCIGKAPVQLAQKESLSEAFADFFLHTFDYLLLEKGKCTSRYRGTLDRAAFGFLSLQRTETTHTAFGTLGLSDFGLVSPKQQMFVCFRESSLDRAAFGFVSSVSTLGKDV